MEIQEAKVIADQWVDLLRPACERIEIAGSIRRGKLEVKDIDLVLIPKVESVPDLFGNPGTQLDQLETILPRIIIEQGALRLKNGPRQKTIRLQFGLTLELWIVRPPAQWGTIFLLRTGPAEFGHWLVSSKRVGGGMPSNMQHKDGALYRHNVALQTPEEADAFRAIGMDYIEPSQRRPGWMNRVQA
jgi:DNA polymerase/3'-5' exonuclease PolX